MKIYNRSGEAESFAASRIRAAIAVADNEPQYMIGADIQEEAGRRIVRKVTTRFQAKPFTSPGSSGYVTEGVMLINGDEIPALMCYGYFPSRKGFVNASDFNNPQGQFVPKGTREVGTDVYTIGKAFRIGSESRGMYGEVWTAVEILKNGDILAHLIVQESSYYGQARKPKYFGSWCVRDRNPNNEWIPVRELFGLLNIEPATEMNAISMLKKALAGEAVKFDAMAYIMVNNG